MSKINQIYCLDEVLLKEEGIGWSLVIDSSKTDFPVLIGGECHSTEITKTEWISLVPTIMELLDQFDEYQKGFVSDESFILEIEKQSWRICLEGLNDQWTLKVILEATSERRGFQMYWPIPSAKAFTSAMRIMWDSYQ